MKNLDISTQRLTLSNKIKLYEKKGWFDVDVNDDPPTRALLVGEVDYKYQKISSRFNSWIANIVASFYFENLIRKKKLIIKEVIGEHNLLKVKGGAIITCNHFHPFDNYAVYKACKKYLFNKRLYKVIREGNYTNFPGIYGYFFRNCNTLPLSSNVQVMKEFNEGLSYHLSKGNKVLIYPEQAMWLNYKKPRPLKDGAFQFAVKNNVPIIPIFITMEDTTELDEDNCFVQAYTVHIMSPIGIDNDLTKSENIKAMRDKTFKKMKDKYEEVYNIPLTYED